MSSSYYNQDESGDYDKFYSPQILTVKSITGTIAGSQAYTGSVTANKFVMKGGTSNQVQLADGTTV